jgi:hypothetical protein
MERLKSVLIINISGISQRIQSKMLLLCCS